MALRDNKIGLCAIPSEILFYRGDLFLKPNSVHFKVQTTVSESFLDKYLAEGTMEKERKRKLSNNSVINQRVSHELVHLSFNFT